MPILILSVVEDRERGFRVGAESYLTKPADPHAVVQEVERLLQRVPLTARGTLLVSEDGGGDEALSEALQQKGYRVLGSCSAADCVVRVRELQPDTVVIHGIADASAMIEDLRTDPEAHHTYVIQLLPEEGSP